MLINKVKILKIDIKIKNFIIFIKVFNNRTNSVKKLINFYNCVNELVFKFLCFS